MFMIVSSDFRCAFYVPRNVCGLPIYWSVKQINKHLVFIITLTLLLHDHDRKGRHNYECGLYSCTITVVHTHTVKSFITVFSLNHRCHDADCTNRPGFPLHSERHITIRERAILHHYTDTECNYRLNIGSCFDIIKSCHTHCTVNTYCLIDHTTCDAVWSTHFLSVWLLHGLQSYKCVTAVNCYLGC